MTAIAQPRALLLAMMDIDPAHEEEFNRWYEEEHLPDRANCCGFLTARRFVAVEGGPKYLALYDLENRHVLASPEYRKIYDPPTAWTRRMRPHFRNAVRNVYIDITAGVRAAENARGSALLLVMADITPALDEEFNRWYDEEHVPERLSIPGFLGGRRFKAVEGEPRYLALYDLKSVDVLASEPYRYFRGAGETAWTRNMLKAMQNFRRGVYASLPSPALTKCERH
jgi:hypothetical protein